jgi:hypothetical protein
MENLLGKRLRKQPIKYWVHDGNKLYRDFPHKGERMMIIHNIQVAKKIEHM